MAKAKATTIGQEHADGLAEATRAFQQAPLAGARDLPILWGLNPRARTTNIGLDNVIIQALDHLSASRKVYLYGDDVVMETDSLNGQSQFLRHLRNAGSVESRAEFVLANVFTCQDGDVSFPPPGWFVNVLLWSDQLKTRLPRIQLYANRPVFDKNFHLCSPGWHPGTGVLIHGPHVEPIMPDTVHTSGPATERLPPHLRTLLSGFCFRSDADMANAFGMMLTGVLGNHFVESPKGLFLIDGNQPSLGKTLFVEVVGMVLDDFIPKRVVYSSNDEEFEKKLCATLRGSWQSVVFIDNAKVRSGSVVSSPVIAEYYPHVVFTNVIVSAWRGATM